MKKLKMFIRNRNDAGLIRAALHECGAICEIEIERTQGEERNRYVGALARLDQYISQLTELIGDDG